MLRNLTVIIDFSKAVLRQDLRPNRAIVAKEMAAKLLNEFHDLNPLGKISVIATMKQQAIMLSDFSQSKDFALKRIQAIDDFEGCPSYQNALSLAIAQFEAINTPRHISKEILIINSSISINDPGDIFTTIEKVVSSRVTCSVFSLSAEINVLL